MKLSTLLKKGIKRFGVTHGELIYRPKNKKACGCAVGTIVLQDNPKAVKFDDCSLKVKKLFDIGSRYAWLHSDIACGLSDYFERGATRKQCVEWLKKRGL